MEDKPTFTFALLRTDQVQAVVCPICGADVGESCRTRDSRKVSKAHTKRIHQAADRLWEVDIGTVDCVSDSGN
jgi:hypothetical protein